MQCTPSFIVSTKGRREDIKPVVSVAFRVEKFNIKSNDHGRFQKCDFSVSHRKYSFWANLVQIIRIVSLS